ncbi:hypothetical protein ACLKA7_009108 [Drosophila subpalustris]
MRHCVALWMSFCVLYVAGTEPDPLLVEIVNGKVRGRDNGGYYSYESIPFAEPPLGELRFEAPRPFVRQWKDTFDATQPPEYCLQWTMVIDGPNKLMGSEDCLTVSVYKPKNDSRSSFPVLAVIHGGAFMFGGAADIGHEYIISRGNMIVVKITYRLGPLGFLSTGDADLPGNLGLKDQHLALNWIKQNIAGFGGEPENIVLFGASAGGASVHLQLLQNDIAQLVKGAISLSGNALDPWVVQQGGREKAFELARLVDCGDLTSSAEVKKCLKSKDAKDIVSAVRHFFVLGYVPFAVFGPVIEPNDAPESFLIEPPEEIIRSGNLGDVPWLISYVTEDGGWNAASLLEKQSDGKELIEELNTRWNELAPDFLFYRYTIGTEKMDKYSDQLKLKYLGDRSFNLDSYLDVQRMFTDILFKNSVKKVIDLYKEYGKGPIYAYVYDNAPEMGLAQWLAKRTDVHFGTVHGDDFFLMFGKQLFNTLPSDKKIVSQNFIQMMEGFAQGSSDGGLTYANCKFNDNKKQMQVQLLSINRDGCENLQVDSII